ncbi:MAG: triose-phosphate isomerase [Candidatus Binatia bacterium]
MKPPLIVGNWKMHGTQIEAFALARHIRRGLKAIKGVEVVLAPPFTALAAVSQAIKGSGLRLSGQNVHWQTEGAFTGEISPKMLQELGCKYVIVGHSERRRLFKESDQLIASKMLASLGAGLRPILCVGETLEERKKGTMTRVIARQLRVALKGVRKNAIEKIAIAYEPVWAIGTGQNATPDQVSHAHCWIREILKDLLGKKRGMRCRILYGGSVRPDNAAALARALEVNGLLVGGASLRARDFLSIVHYFLT